MKNSSLRELARSDFWIQTYRASKENGISLFDNSKDLSHLQIVFLSYLNLYDSLYSDITADMLDGAVLDIERIKSDFLVDCYLSHKRKKNKKIEKKETKKNNTGIPSISFVQGKREE